MWNPGFEYISSSPAVIRSFKRRFWYKSGDHRGTPEFHGYVVSVIEGNDCDFVEGILFQFDTSLSREILEYLDIREKYGYIRRLTRAFCPREKVHNGFSA